MMTGVGSSASSSIYICPPAGAYYNSANGVGADYIVDSGPYPSANSYDYYYTGMQSSGEWGNDNTVGLDSNNFHMSADHLPYGYYSPDYGYAYSSTDQFAPFIPGTFVGIDGSRTVAQQYIAAPQQYVSASLYQTSVPPYIPVYVQPSTDFGYDVSREFPTLSSAATNINRPPTVNLKTRNQVPLSSTSQNFTSANHAVISCQNFGHNRNTNKTLEGPDSSVPLENCRSHLKSNFSSIGTAGSKVGSPTKMMQSTHNLAPEVTSLQCPQNGTSPIIGSDGIKQSSGNDNYELNRQIDSVEVSSSAVDLSPPSSSQIIIHRDHFNKEDFAVDYPDAKFFVIKSYSEDDVHKSIKHNVWSSTPNGNRRLDSAYSDAQRRSFGKPNGCPVFLFFSVNMSGQFCGVAEMVGPVDFQEDKDFWQQDKWPGSFPVKWHIIKDVPNTLLRQVILENNENKPVTSSRDTQEVPYKAGVTLLKLFKDSPLNTSVLDDFAFYEERQKTMVAEKCRRMGKSSDSSLYIPAFVAKTNAILTKKLGQTRVKVTIKAPPAQSDVAGDEKWSLGSRVLKKDAVPNRILKRGELQLIESSDCMDRTELQVDVSAKDLPGSAPEKVMPILEVDEGNVSCLIMPEKSKGIACGDLLCPITQSSVGHSFNCFGGLSIADVEQHNLSKACIQNDGSNQDCVCKFTKATIKGEHELTESSEVDEAAEGSGGCAQVSDGKKGRATRSSDSDIATKADSGKIGKKNILKPAGAVIDADTNGKHKESLNEQRSGSSGLVGVRSRSPDSKLGTEGIPIDVVKVGSVQIKVNGTGKASSQVF